jgi:hypothetical protein
MSRSGTCIIDPVGAWVAGSDDQGTRPPHGEISKRAASLRMGPPNPADPTALLADAGRVTRSARPGAAHAHQMGTRS